MQQDPDFSDEFVDAVARRLLELSRRKLTVADVARIYGVHPSWVYAHADQLDAIRLGTGPKAPLRFDPETLDDRIRGLAQRRAATPVVEERPPMRPAQSPARPRRPPKPAPRTPYLLPVGGDVMDATEPMRRDEGLRSPRRQSKEAS